MIFWMIGSFALGFVIARSLHRLVPGRRIMRLSILIVAPFAIIVAWPIFSDGWPERDDWVWLRVLLMILTPVWGAWFVGAGIEAIVRRSMSDHD